VNADPAAQLRLLDLQALDTALAQLAHRRRSLPELAQLAENATQLGAARDEMTTATVQIDDIDREQKRLESDVEVVRSRAARDTDRMQAGGLPGRELEGLQHEIATLARRQSALEDEVLEVMEQREAADEALRAATERAEELAAVGREAIGRRDAAFAQIDADVVAHAGRRAVVAKEIPADLLSLYEKVRDSSGGQGAAALKQRRCEGCRLELAGNELSTVRAAAPDLVLRCENCRRILVRTAESGL
jgi:predicted  nucleic acid-binding Zn-ribbon protein